MEELRTEAEKLAEDRRIARERAMEWTREVQMESDEERERKLKKAKKPKGEVMSGDEAEPKKKRRGKLKKATSDQGDEEHSEEEEAEKPAKKVLNHLIGFLPDLGILTPLQRPAKKRVVRDDDEEDAGPRKKQLYVSTMSSNCLDS